MLENLINKLSLRIKEPLPGSVAQRLMMPLEADDERFDLHLSKKAKLGGVLILIYPQDNNLYFPLMERHEYDGHHSGQVSLPGGKYEENDQSIIHTAIREANEEIGVKQEDIHVIGQLTDIYIPPSNFKVTPVLAYSRKKPLFEIDTFEVKKLIEVPLTQLQDERIIRHKNIWTSKGIKLITPYYAIDNNIVWGATAMILSELLYMIKEIEPGSNRQ